MTGTVELVRRDTQLEIAAPSPEASALVPWAVEMTDGQIVVAGAAIHPIVARDLWMRLGALLGEAERDGERAEWERLGAELERQFRRATPASGRTLDRPSMEVHGVIVREREGVAAMRLATFSIAVLRPRKRGWEGPVYALRPTQTGHDRRAIGTWVRVPAERVEGVARAELPGPVAPPAAVPRSTRAPEAPRAPGWLEERREQIRELHAAILAYVPGVGDVIGHEDLAGSLRIARDELRAHLDTLVDAGELVEVRGAAGPAWRRVERPRGKDAAKRGKRGRTKVAAPKVRAKAPRPPKRVEKPRPPSPPIALECRACDRVTHVPAGVAIPADPRCRVCHGPLRRLS